MDAKEIATVNARILALEAYRDCQLYGALLGVFKPADDIAALAAFTAGDLATLKRLTAGRIASEGMPVFVDATEVFPAGKEPEHRIRKKGETWNALTLRVQGLESREGTRAFARVLLEKRGEIETPFS